MRWSRWVTSGTGYEPSASAGRERGAMDRLDGNAIAGTMAGEMTTAVGTCGGCGRVAPLAEVAVYLLTPGVVARCPDCDKLLMVIVDRRGMACVELAGLASLEQPPATLP
jgi:hypothetical protein